jgi:hypothetical protein
MSAPFEENIPEDANEGCVGPQSEEAGKTSGCAGCPNQGLGLGLGLGLELGLGLGLGLGIRVRLRLRVRVRVS